MKKRALSLILALVMVCALLPTAAGAVTVTEIVPCKYDEVKGFSEGLAVVKQDGKWGLVDATGREVEPCKYVYIREFTDGFAKVNVGGHIYGGGIEGGKWYFVDKTGKEIGSKYGEVENFSEGLAAVSVFDEEREGYKWGFIDTTDKEVVPCKYDDVNSFSEGLAAVRLDDKWGIIDKTGKEVVPCTLEYDGVGSFHDGLAIVRVGDYFDNKKGFIDTNGKEVIPCTLEYDIVENFSEGRAGVQLNGKYGYIDKTGKEVAPCKYKGKRQDGGSVMPQFYDGLAAVQDETGKWGFIDKTGAEVIPCQYYFVTDFENGCAKVEGSTGQIVNGHSLRAAGVIDTRGNMVVPLGKYGYVSDFSEDLAGVKLDGKLGFIDITGKEVIPCTLEYDYVGYFHDGLAAVKIGADIYGDGGKWGFIDKTGKEVVPCTLEYDQVEKFFEGLAAVKQDGKWGFIDKTGAEVIPCQYDEAWNMTATPTYTYEFHEGLAKVKTSNGYGCIDLHGNEVVPCQYGQVKLLSAGLVAVTVDDKWGILRVEGLPTEPKPATAPTPTPEPTTPNTYTAKATNDKLTVGGVSKAPTAYKINNANYFQLRDVAVLLNSTKAQFSVEYDNTAKAIKITTGQPYQPNGKEMKGAKATAEAIVGNNDVYINGVKTDFKVYKISGSNFFQIRDLGKALGFHVDWAKDVGIIIDPSKPYGGK